MDLARGWSRGTSFQVRSLFFSFRVMSEIYVRFDFYLFTDFFFYPVSDLLCFDLFQHVFSDHFYSV